MGWSYMPGSIRIERWLEIALPQVRIMCADSILSGQNPSSLVMCFFKHSDRIQINDIRVATEGESAAGYGWLDCLAEAQRPATQRSPFEAAGSATGIFRAGIPTAPPPMPPAPPI